MVSFDLIIILILVIIILYFLERFVGGLTGFVVEIQNLFKLDVFEKLIDLLINRH